jgi:chloramphenicol 3-O-phosphotransferase
VLIVINGPIASGKSTLARAVAREMQAHGAKTALVDVDLLYDMLDAAVGVPKGNERSWHLARAAAAALTDTFLDGGVDAVLVEGRFFAEERAEYLAGVHSLVDPRFVTLRVSYDEALRRAQADPTRGASRDPAFLRPYFVRVERDLASVPDTDLVLDTQLLDLDQCVAEVIGFVRRSY